VLVPEEGAVLEELSRDECFELVSTRRVGRLAVMLRAGSPHVVPVNYLLHDETIVFRSGPGAKLTALRERPVSFQVDAFDELQRTGWSVLIQGIAHDSETPPPGLAIDPWVPGERDHWVRITPGAVGGRRITVPARSSDGRGYL
jgi:hypothetical protein